MTNTELKGKSVSEILKQVCSHDQVVLDLLLSEQQGFTTIQIANQLKRARIDVKYTMDRLLQAKEVRKGNQFNYGKWTAVNFDFVPQVIAKRPNEANGQIKGLQQLVNELTKLCCSMISEMELEPATGWRIDLDNILNNKGGE